MPEAAALAARFRKATGVAWRLAIAREPLPLDRLTLRERELHDALRSPSRRQEWLRGRAALKRLLGRGAETAGLTFPSARLSLTHAGGVAVAAGAEGSGTGVDLEVRAPSERAARRFLSAAEFEVAGGPDGWLRLWTVKEACFKADLANAGATLPEYEVEDPGADAGWAFRKGRATRFRYASARAFGGWLTAAVHPG